MNVQLPLINRDEELAHIARLVEAWGTRNVLCIEASGGIGKTRLLQEVHHRYMASTTQPLLTCDIIDFDDRSLRLRENLALKIGHMLGDHAFVPYIQKLMHWRQIELAGYQPERLKEESQAVNQVFIECFNAVSQHRRVVLLFDTTEALEGSDVLDFFVKCLPHMMNYVAVMAGRNGHKIARSLQASIGTEDVQDIELEPLALAAGQQYLEQKQEHLLVEIAPHLVEKLLFLAAGRPILLDLAVEWSVRSIPIDWMVDYSLEALRALPEDELQAKHLEFERRLVAHIIDTRHQIDWLILWMARIYPLDQHMIAYFLQLDQQEAQRLFEEARSYVFVKVLPGEQISLHDEMRRMVNAYVWPEIDPSGEHQRKDSETVIAYLEQQIEEWTAALQTSGTHTHAVDRPKDTPGDTHIFEQTEVRERELWVLREQLLHHTLFIDLQKGIDLFVSLFEEAGRASRLSFSGAFLNRVQTHRDQLSKEQKYTVDLYQIEYLKNCGLYERAQELTNKLLKKDDDVYEKVGQRAVMMDEEADLPPMQRTRLLIQSGNLAIRRGNIEQGIRDFAEAISISEMKIRFPSRIQLVSNIKLTTGTRDHDAWQEQLIRGLNARGWAYRNQGNYNRALSDYQRAYLLSLDLGDLNTTAQILNNMGYLHGLTGNANTALESSEMALSLWEQQDNQRGISSAYSTLGAIERQIGKVDKALDYCTRAIDAFQEENNTELMALALSRRAFIFLDQGRLNEAEQDLARAFEQGAEHLKPSILHCQAVIARERGDLKQAWMYLEDCQKTSRKIGNKSHDMKSFSDLIELAWEFGEFSRWRMFKHEYEAHYQHLDTEEARRLSGSILRKIGDLAICDYAYPEAVAAYKQGLVLIAENEVIGRYTVAAQIQQMIQRIEQKAEPYLMRQLGKEFIRFWPEQHALLNRYPVALITFYKWQQHYPEQERKHAVQSGEGPDYPMAHLSSR
jgi:tetratricopeptide (TPR) repeat protein